MFIDIIPNRSSPLAIEVYPGNVGDPRGNTRQWHYDSRNLVLWKGYPTGGGRTSYRYDALGREIIKGENSTAAIYRTYDLAGRMTRRVHAPTGTWTNFATAPHPIPGPRVLFFRLHFGLDKAISYK